VFVVLLFEDFSLTIRLLIELGLVCSVVLNRSSVRVNDGVHLVNVRE